MEAVKKELFLAGIRSEIRSNPLAEALRVTRLELWLEDERDLFNASKLYATLQGRASGKAAERAPAPQSNPAEEYIEVEVSDEPNQPQRPMSEGHADSRSEPNADEVSQASALLEKEIEKMLQRESELTTACAALQSQVNELTQKLAQSQADITREAESRAAVEKKLSAEVSKLQGAIEREKKERVRAEETLEREKGQIQQKLQSRDEAVRVAEERAAKAVVARESLEKQLQAQKERQMHAYAESLNTLRSKLQAKRTGRPD